MAGAGGVENPAGIQATVMAAQEVRVSATPVLKEFPQEKARDDFEVLVRVEAPKDAKLHAPIDLVAVVDVSGSMGWSAETGKKAEDGERTRLDLVKDAMAFIVGHLHAGDRLAMVAFDHNVHPDFTTGLRDISDDSRESLAALVRSVKVRGWTLFAPGLDKAVEILETRSETERKKRPGFIVFLSDGIELLPEKEAARKALDLSKRYPSPNHWDSDAGGTKEYKALRGRLKKQTVHTFGFTKAHDPGALRAIADLAGGTYSFINTGLDKIMDTLGLCLAGLQTVVATDVTVGLAVQDARVRITDIDSGGYRSWFDAETGGLGEITIPALYDGEVKDFVVHLSVPAHDRAGKQLLISADTKWGPVSVSPPPGDGDGDGDAMATMTTGEEDAEVVLKRPPHHQVMKPNAEVMKHVLRFKFLWMLGKFLSDNKGRLKGEKNIDDAVTNLGKMWVDLKNENASVVDAVGPGVVEGYDGHVADTQSGLRNGDGGAHAMSLGSSKASERVTSMGSPDNTVDEYKTPAIDNIAAEFKKQREPPPEVVAQPVVAPEEKPWPCACLEYDMIHNHLAYWSVIKRDLLRLVEQVEGDGGHHTLTHTFHDLSLASINRAMYESVFLAVEHAHNLRCCYCAATGHQAVAAVYDGEER